MPYAGVCGSLYALGTHVSKHSTSKCSCESPYGRSKETGGGENVVAHTFSVHAAAFLQVGRGFQFVALKRA